MSHPYVRERSVFLVSLPRVDFDGITTPASFSSGGTGAGWGTTAWYFVIAALFAEDASDPGSDWMYGIASDEVSATPGADADDLTIKFNYVPGITKYRLYGGTSSGSYSKYTDLTVSASDVSNGVVTKVLDAAPSNTIPAGQPKTNTTPEQFQLVVGEITLPTPQVEYEQFWEVGTIEPSVTVQKGRELTGSFSFKLVNGTFFRSVLGSVSRSGTSPYTHVFTPGRPLPLFDVLAEYEQIGLVGSSQRMWFKKCLVESLKISGEAKEPVTGEISFLAHDYKDVSSLNLVNPAALDVDPFMFYDGSFVLGSLGTVATVKSFELEINNNPESFYFASRVPSKIIGKNTEYSFKVTMVIQDTTLWDLVKDSGADVAKIDGSGVNITLARTSGSDQVKFTFTNVYPKPGQFMIPEQGQVEVDVDFVFESLQVEVIDSTKNYGV